MMAIPWWVPLGAAGIGGAFDLIGQGMGNAANAADAQAGRDWQANQNFLNREAAGAQFREQQLLAREGVRMRVADAKEAGIHPLAALGMSPQGGSPIPIGTGGAPGGHGSRSGALGRMGQNITRAALAAATQNERAHTAKMQGLQEERAALENQLIRGQIQQLNNPPLSVQKSQEFVGSHPDLRGVEPRAVNAFSFYKTPTGISYAPSQDVKDRTEDQILYELQHSWQGLMGALEGSLKPPMEMMRREFPGAVGMKYNKWRFEWEPVYRKQLP